MTEQPEPRWRRLEPDQRRMQILAAAAERFGNSTYASVSVEEIAADAGVARALVNHYFGNKRALYLEVVRTMMFVPANDHAAWTGATRRERIEAVIGWLMDVVEARGRGWLTVATAGGVGSDPEVQLLLDEADDLAAARVLELVGYSGEPSEHAAALASIRAFGGMAKAIGRELIERGTLTSAQARRQLVVALEAILIEIMPPDEHAH